MAQQTMYPERGDTVVLDSGVEGVVAGEDEDIVWLGNSEWQIMFEARDEDDVDSDGEVTVTWDSDQRVWKEVV